MNKRFQCFVEGYNSNYKSMKSRFLTNYRNAKWVGNRKTIGQAVVINSIGTIIIRLDLTLNTTMSLENIKCLRIIVMFSKS